jgi:hypothetical protein
LINRLVKQSVNQAPRSQSINQTQPLRLSLIDCVPVWLYTTPREGESQFYDKSYMILYCEKDARQVRGSNDYRKGHPGPLSKRISRKAASLNCSSPVIKHGYASRLTRLDRMGVNMWGAKCRDSSDTSCTRVCTGTSTAAIAASDARSSGFRR